VFAGDLMPEEAPWTPPTGAELAGGTVVTQTTYFRPYERKIEVGPLPRLRLLRR